MTVRYYDPLPLYRRLGWPGWYCDRCAGVKLDLPSSDPAEPAHHTRCPDYAPPPTREMKMRTRLELTLEIEHPDDYDPANQFVWYFCDDVDLGFDPQPKDIHVQREAWWKVK